MKPLFFILRKSFINSFKELRKKPLTLIFYILAAMFAVLMIVLVFIMPSNILRRGNIDTFGALVSAALLVFVYFGIKQGINNGSSFFRLADVNLVFTAPISPKKVLVYGFIQQVLLTLFTMLFMTLQIPNLKNNFPITNYGISIIYLSVFFLFFTRQLIGMLIYSIASKSQKIRIQLERGLNGLVLLFAGGFLLAVLQTKDFIKATVLYLNHEFFNYLPFLGWFKVIIVAAVKGIDAAFYLNLMLVLGSFLGMILAIYKLKIDYYEDVLAATERREQLITAKKQGKRGLSLRNIKVKKVDYTYGGTGVKAVFFRHILEYKKTSFFFVNRNTLLLAAIGIASKYFYVDLSIRTVLYFSVYILFFFSLQGKWVQELSKPFIYLIPADGAHKVFYATLAENLKNGIDGMVLFIAVGFMYKSDILIILLSGISYMTFGTIFTYGDLLSRKLFGENHSIQLTMFFKMGLLFLVIIPGIIISSCLGWVLKGNNLVDCFSLLVLIGYNLLAALLILLGGKEMFEKLELR